MKKYLTSFAIVLLCSLSSKAQEETPGPKKLPIGASIYFENNIGAGTAFEVYKQDPYIASSLYLSPYIKLGPFLGDREVKIKVGLSSSFEWLSGGKSSSAVGDKFSFADVKLSASVSNALVAKELGLSLTPSLKLSAPNSEGSRLAKRILGFGGSLSAKWSMNGFFVKLGPSVTAYAHSGQTSKKQTLVKLKNGISTGYSNGAHSFVIGMGIHHAFLRAAKKNQNRKKSSDVKESTSGVVEYTYDEPFNMPISMSLGLSSQQSSYDIGESFRMPFFSFAEPNKNYTELYLGVGMTI